MALNLRKFENQATLSVLLAGASAILAVAGAGLMLRNLKWQQFIIVFRSNSMFQPAVLGALGLALLVGIIGFGIAFNSAGQKRNSKSRLSWIGFFLNAGALTLALIAVVFFMLLRDPVGGG